MECHSKQIILEDLGIIWVVNKESQINLDTSVSYIHFNTKSKKKKIKQDIIIEWMSALLNRSHTNFNLTIALKRSKLTNFGSISFADTFKYTDILWVWLHHAHIEYASLALKIFENRKANHSVKKYFATNVLKIELGIVQKRRKGQRSQGWTRVD